jgi:hypothetical protein
VTPAQVRQAEDQFGVMFDDYRQYLLRVSADGRVRTLRFDRAGCRWDGDRRTDHTKLHIPFPDHDTALAASEDLWLNEPQQGDYVSAPAYQVDHDAWREAADAAEDARTSGAVSSATTAAASPHSW